MFPFFIWSRYLCKELKTSDSDTLLLKPFSKFWEQTLKMKFLSVILLSLFISVKSSTSTQDGTFHKNGKTNGENLSVSILGYTSSLKDQSPNSEMLNFRNACSKTKPNRLIGVKIQVIFSII